MQSVLSIALWTDFGVLILDLQTVFLCLPLVTILSCELLSSLLIPSSPIWWNNSRDLVAVAVASFCFWTYWSHHGSHHGSHGSCHGSHHGSHHGRGVMLVLSVSGFSRYTCQIWFQSGGDLAGAVSQDRWSVTTCNELYVMECDNTQGCSVEAQALERCLGMGSKFTWKENYKHKLTDDTLCNEPLCAGTGKLTR